MRPRLTMLVLMLCAVCSVNLGAASTIATHVVAHGWLHYSGLALLIPAAILSGRYGLVRWDATGLPSPPTPLTVISLDSWKLSLKTDYIDVTCFQDTNKVYVQGMRDIGGSLTGFWNSSNYVLVTATASTVAGYLELTPNTNEGTYKFGGLAYMDADIDCQVKGAPKLSGSFKAAGPWTTP